MEMNQCKIIQDLLPLYTDGLCSPETKEFIKEHLENCEECKKYFEEMSDLIIPESTLHTMAKELKETNDFILHLFKKWKHQKIASILTVTAIILFLFFSAFIPLTTIEFVEVPTSEMSVKTVNNLDGSFTYTLKVQDNNFTQVMMYDAIENGKYVMYFTATRPFWNITPKDRRELYASSEKKVTIYPDEYYYENPGDLKLDKIYAGTPEDRILIWERKPKTERNTQNGTDNTMLH